jgi:tetratricopeptide (TPR) repeat protein
MLAFDKANDDGDLYAAHAAAHEVMSAAPNSEFRLDLAWSALIVGRATEALTILSTAGSDSVLLQGNLHYWRVMLNAHHALGNYEQELTLAQAALRRNPDNRLFMQFNVRALSALRRSHEVEAICKQSLRYTAHDGWALQPCGQAVTELLAHGLPAEAGRLSAYVEEVSTAAPAVGNAVDPLTISRMRINIGDYEGARRALVPVTADDARYNEYLDQAAIIAASRGDRDHVTKYLQQFDARPVTENRLKGSGAIRHAELEALLGNRDAAVSWVARALREGFWWRHNLHAFQWFATLRDYPPALALLKPVAGAHAGHTSR